MASASTMLLSPHSTALESRTPNRNLGIFSELRLLGTYGVDECSSMIFNKRTTKSVHEYKKVCAHVHDCLVVDHVLKTYFLQVKILNLFHGQVCLLGTYIPFEHEGFIGGIIYGPSRHSPHHRDLVCPLGGLQPDFAKPPRREHCWSDQHSQA